jgi:peptidoglycan hydrolase-like protein with peptidoglycan-binding domain
MADPTPPADDDLNAGTTGAHPSPETTLVRVAPTTDVAQNTVRAFLVPVGCWRIDDVRFEFDSSAVLPGAVKEMKLLQGLVKEHPGAPLSLFGHADPVGDDDYNKRLSGRRAMAIYAMLIRDTDMWEELYSKPAGNDYWGTKSIQRMLATVEDSDVAVDGIVGTQTTGALKSFQQKNGLPANGVQNAATRKKLFAAYMDAVCPLKLGKAEFLAQGADPDGKGDFQGCSEFNPVLMFSAAEQEKFKPASKHAARNEENAPNRRVMALLFRPGTVVDPGRWPCPTAKEGVAKCKKRFWSDAAKRRTFQEKRRTFEADKDTYACRFYHRLFVLSPCGSATPVVGTKVLEIRASILGTRSVRKPTDRRATATLTSSTSTEEDLSKNTPVILVRGCNEVALEAITAPSGPVVWTVTPNESSSSVPVVTPTDGGRKAKLKTDKGGAFSVIAAVGSSRVVWNVVFVSVEIDVARSKPLLVPGLYKDNGSDASSTSIKSGEFGKPGQFAWQLDVTKIKLVGGGSKGDLGIDKVKLHYLQNGVTDTLQGNYAGGAIANEVTKSPLPVCDSNGNPAVNPTADAASMFTVTPDQKSALRDVRMGDSPGGGFARTHKNTKTLLATISGVNGFRAAVGSTSEAAPDAFVVHADIRWQANFAGNVDTNPKNAATYTANGAKTTSDAQLTLISPSTGGQDAGEAGFELFPIQFNNGGTTTTFTP